LRLDAGLDWTVNWYKNFLGGQSALTLTERQIDQFSKLDG
jgi:hypothetical protein